MSSHHKAASCSFISSMHSLRPLSSQTESDQEVEQKSTRADSSLFPLPSFCLYSKSALLNEYAPESDIIQYLSPKSVILEERLPMFVGVLQSLFTVVNDLPFTNEEEEDDDEEEEEEEEQTEEEEEEEEEQNFIIIGLSSIKLIVWKDITLDLCLVIIVSSQFTDSQLLTQMELLKKSIMNDIDITTLEIGNLLKPLVEYWFEFQGEYV